jgi:DNA polymerase (family 10)
MTKEEVAAILNELGTLLEIKGESSFRTQAYHNASRELLQLEGDFKALVEAGKLSEVRGIGTSMQEKIVTLVRTGTLTQLDELRTQIPSGVLQMLRIPGLGPKKAKALYDELGLESLDALQRACEANQVAALKGFGKKTQEKILEGLRFVNEIGQRVRIDLAYPLGIALLQQLSQLPGVIRAALCGSLRRRRETAKDIDILISSANAKPIMDAFVALPEVLQVTGHGETKSSIIAAMHIGAERVVLNADLRVVADEFFPFALHHFTGSKDHNVRMRSRAQDMGMSLSEYGLTKGNQHIACASEEEIFAALGLAYVPPEMREDTGEVAAAEARTLPNLVTLQDVRGVFHNHTTYSDGTASLEAMALAAKQLGLEYFGVGDHSQSLRMAGGLTPNAVRKQHQEIDEVNARLQGVQIIKGTECDILEDGSLDYSDELLTTFDYVVASVHTHFGMSSEEMTARVCKALAHPAVTMLGHATGRLLLRRDSYKIDLDEVLKVAAKYGKMIEINAQPMRLDLDWVYVKKAKALGIPLVINPDAHATDELAYYSFGVDVARRGWLEKSDVFNTQSYAAVMQELRRRKGNGA